MPFRPETFAQKRDRLKPRPFAGYEDRQYDRTKRIQGGNAIASDIRHSKAWNSLRRMYFAEYPLCADPFGVHKILGVTVPAQDVHHKVSIQKDPSLAFDQTNLISLCRSCHAVFSQREREGR